MSEFLRVLSKPDVWGILARFVVNLIFLFILIVLIYFRYSKKEKFLFTFFLTGITVFMVCSIMNKLSLGLGAAFGLFAIFQVLRFRTRNFGVKDMAYIFTAIGISVINSVVLQIFNILGVLIMNSIILLSAFFLEVFLDRNVLKRHKIIFHDLEMLRPENREKLKQELSVKTGTRVRDIRILEVNLKKGKAELDIFFKE